MAIAIRERESGAVLAEAEPGAGVIEYEGNLYFDPAAVDAKALRVTGRTYTCPYKGTCNWVDFSAGARDAIGRADPALPQARSRCPSLRPDLAVRPDATSGDGRSTGLPEQVGGRPRWPKVPSRRSLGSGRGSRSALTSSSGPLWPGTPPGGARGEQGHRPIRVTP